MSSTDVFGDLSNFFKQLGALNTADQIDDFFKQYWYVWLILSIGLVVLIVVNVLICCYFRHHRKLNEVDKKTKEKRIYNKDWGIPKPVQTLYIPVESNLGVDNPLVDEYDDSKFAIEALMAHNELRLRHGAVPLQLNEYCSKAATDWAKELAKMNQLKHSPDQWRRYNGAILGENLYFFMGPVLRGDRMTEAWYREMKNHDFNNDLQEHSLHFSQIVWKSTREVGFGRCMTPDKKNWYGVALYYPPGNFPLQYAENVQPRSDMEDARLA